MIDDLMEKYEDMTEEEFEALPEEEKAKITKEMEAEGEKMAAEMKKALDSLSDEEKASMKEAMEAGQKEAERVSKLTEEEIMAEMMNPETDGYDEEDLKAAREMIRNQKEGYEPESVTSQLAKNAASGAKRGLWYAVRSFFRGLMNK